MNEVLLKIGLSAGFTGLLFWYVQYSYKKKIKEAEAKYLLTMKILEHRQKNKK